MTPQKAAEILDKARRNWYLENDQRLAIATLVAMATSAIAPADSIRVRIAVTVDSDSNSYAWAVTNRRDDKALAECLGNCVNGEASHLCFAEVDVPGISTVQGRVVGTQK